VFWKTLIFQLIFIGVIFIFVYGFLKKRVLSKLHPNRKIILALSVIAFFLPSVTSEALKLQKGIGFYVLQYTGTAIFIILFLWFLDLHNDNMYDGRKAKKDIKIRPKAKPNRARKNKK
jgi:hypothetical protein